jgi:hypothetical protein
MEDKHMEEKEKKRLLQVGDLVAYSVDKLCKHHKVYHDEEDNRSFWQNFVAKRDPNLLLVTALVADSYSGDMVTPAVHLFHCEKDSNTDVFNKRALCESERLFDIVASARKAKD